MAEWAHLFVDVVPECLLYFTPGDFGRILLTCKTLYRADAVHGLVVRLAASSILHVSLPYNVERQDDRSLLAHATLVSPRGGVHRPCVSDPRRACETWPSLYKFIYDRPKGRVVSGVQLCAGAEHSAMVTDSGEVYTWGYGVLGVLGHSDARTQHVPCRVKTFSSGTGSSREQSGPRVLGLSCGEQHTLALTNEGVVMAWGWNSNGRLGFGGPAKDPSSKANVLVRTPTRIRPTVRITQISAGGSHSLLLTSFGTVFAFGKNSNGQCGDGTVKDRLGPTVVRFEKVADQPDVTIIQAIAGHSHSLFLTSEGTLYACGCASGGRLGLPDTGKDRLSPGLVNGQFGKGASSPKSLSTYATFVTAGSSHNMLVDNLDRVWSWGWGAQGCLGLDQARMSVDHKMDTPTVIESLLGIPIASASAGTSHSIVVSKDGAVFTFGFGRMGRLGHGGEENEMRPRVIDSLLGHYKILQACAGGTHSVFLTECSQVLTCGWSVRGQTGLANVDREAVVHPVPLKTLNGKFFVETGKEKVSCLVTNKSKVAACKLQLFARASMAKKRVREELHRTWIKVFDYRSGYYYYHNTRSGCSQWTKPCASILGLTEDILPTPRSKRVAEQTAHVRSSPPDELATIIQRYFRGYKSRASTKRFLLQIYEKLYDPTRNTWYYFSNASNSSAWRLPFPGLLTEEDFHIPMEGLMQCSYVHDAKVYTDVKLQV
eukprot:Stramenopile-MAST_4_protein_4167